MNFFDRFEQFIYGMFLFRFIASTRMDLSNMVPRVEGTSIETVCCSLAIL